MPQRGKTHRSNIGPRASFRIYGRKDGGLRVTDESTDPDGTIIARLWTTSVGRKGSGKVLILQPGREEKQVRIQLTVEDDHQMQSTVAKEVTLGAKAGEIEEVTEIEPFEEVPEALEAGEEEEGEGEEDDGWDPVDGEEGSEDPQGEALEGEEAQEEPKEEGSYRNGPYQHDDNEKNKHSY